MLCLQDFRSKAKGLPDLLTYAALIAPGVVLQKDGSFLAGYEVRGQDTASAVPANETLSVVCAAQVLVPFAATRYGSEPSSVLRPRDADVANELRVSMRRIPASTVSWASAFAPGMSKPTKPAPVTHRPASPRLSMLASTTVAAVWYDDTTFAPARALASAATCVSPARDMLHVAVTAENSSANTTKMDTAAASVV